MLLCENSFNHSLLPTDDSDFTAYLRAVGKRTCSRARVRPRRQILLGMIKQKSCLGWPKTKLICKIFSYKKEAQKPYFRGGPLRICYTSALARGRRHFIVLEQVCNPRTAHSSTRKISPGRVKPSKPWVDYVPPPVPVPAKEIRAPSLDQMERDLREWTIKKDAIQQAMHEGAKQEYARAAATIEQLGQQEVEQRERCKRALSELKSMQLELFEANRKIEILEGSNAALRKRAAEAEAARDSLQGERKKLHNELPKVTKDATERADFLEKKLAEAEATRIEQVQRQILRRIMHRDWEALLGVGGRCPGEASVKRDELAMRRSHDWGREETDGSRRRTQEGVGRAQGSSNRTVLKPSSRSRSYSLLRRRISRIAR